VKTLIIGLGNPILGDDGVGWSVAEAVAKRIKEKSEVEVSCYALGGLSLMEHMTGYERVILIDSLHSHQNPIGTVQVFPLSDLSDPVSGHTTAVHDTSLRNALRIGRNMGIPLPEDEKVTVVAIEAERVYDFSEQLSPPVEDAVPEAVEAVIKLLN
jgi:hydrogenase maturation protease